MLNELVGNYEYGQDPIERLRNKLHPLLGLLDIIKSDDYTLEEIKQIMKSVDTVEIQQYLDDVTDSIKKSNLSYLESYNNFRK